MGRRTQSDLDRIRDRVDERSTDICATVLDAVRISSEVPPGRNYASIVDFFRATLNQLGLATRVEVISDDVVEGKIRRYRADLGGPRLNLVAESSSNKPKAAFYCHLDTVPVGDRSKWSFDPLVPFVRDQYIWGRGAADSKAGATAILWAFRILRELGIELQVSPTIALTTDEEIGPYSGLMYLTDIGALDGCQWFYSADGLAGAVGYGSPGSLLWTVRVAGRSVHSASAFLGINPVERAVPLMEALLQAKQAIEQRVSSLPLSPEVAAESGRTHIAGLLNITTARTGDVQTLVPPEFILAGDRLFMPGETQREVASEIEQIVEAARRADPSLDCTFESNLFYEPFSQDDRNPWLRRVQQIVSTIQGHDVPFAGLGGPTDVAYVANCLGIPVAIHGVIRYRDSRTHGPDERCKVSDLLNLTKVIACLAAGVIDQ